MVMCGLTYETMLSLKRGMRKKSGDTMRWAIRLFDAKAISRLLKSIVPDIRAFRIPVHRTRLC
jgi:hypothetical protein